MRVLLVHNFYGTESPSGEKVSYLAERDMLVRRGAEVIEFVRHSDSIRSRGSLGTIIGGALTPWNMSTALQIRALAKSTNPDIVHVHNTFPLISPAIFWSLRNLPCAIVLSLHNLRLFCAKGMPMRDGKICTVCLDTRSVIPGLRYACYRGSVVATTPLAVSISLHRRMGTWNKCVDAFIALTNYQRNLVIKAGLPRDRVHVKPHFYPGSPSEIPWSARDDKAIFIGRLSAEKGYATLLKAWALQGESAPGLDIIGDGPDRGILETEIKMHRLSRVHLLGQLSFSETQERIARSKLLIVPSTWEGFPLVIREAFAFGVPVAASRIGALMELVADGVNGALFQPNAANELAELIRRLWDNPITLEHMSAMARQSYIRAYTEEANGEILQAIYNSAKVAKGERN
jgi:glycosyltransferase involved in cell wall biosynthesis